MKQVKHMVIAQTGWQRARGLMFQKQITADTGLLIPHCNAIHTCFMRFPIRVLMLSATGKVLGKFEIKPWRISKIYWGAWATLELAPNNRAWEKVRCGQKLEVLPKKSKT